MEDQRKVGEDRFLGESLLARAGWRSREDMEVHLPGEGMAQSSKGLSDLAFKKIPFIGWAVFTGNGNAEAGTCPGLLGGAGHDLKGENSTMKPAALPSYSLVIPR
jgi:hypothetical protein